MSPRRTTPRSETNELFATLDPTEGAFPGMKLLDAALDQIAGGAAEGFNLDIGGKFTLEPPFNLTFVLDMGGGEGGAF